MGTPPLLVAVTGATGFIGTILCTELRKSGNRVRALVRNPDRARVLQGSGVELLTGELADRSSLEQLLSEADAVIHCAGAVRGSSQQQFDQTNVAGTEGLLQAMLAQGSPPRLIMLSSLAAREPELSWYANSKYRSEVLLREQGKGLNWITLRPPPVYGPGDKEILPLFRAMSRGLAPVPGAISARISVIHVQDLVAAILACLDTADMPATEYCLGDGHDGGYDWKELAEIAESVWQRQVRLLSIPGWLLDVVASANLGLARVLGYAPMLTPAKLRELRHPDWVVDNDKLQAVIDWQPRIGLQQGLIELKETEL
ncbi:MAG: NAD-dependent epimerase/dehydratase family protein [Gammaproteobacteria bacterium]|nr:NAD-dependent epimerase/dehydratase family protein [Gammaproteobacteria bacterium]